MKDRIIGYVRSGVVIFFYSQCSKINGYVWDFVMSHDASNISICQAVCGTQAGTSSVSCYETSAASTSDTRRTRAALYFRRLKGKHRQLHSCHSFHCYWDVLNRCVGKATILPPAESVTVGQSEKFVVLSWPCSSLFFLAYHLWISTYS